MHGAGPEPRAEARLGRPHDDHIGRPLAGVPGDRRRQVALKRRGSHHVDLDRELPLPLGDDALEPPLLLLAPRGPRVRVRATGDRGERGERRRWNARNDQETKLRASPHRDRAGGIGGPRRGLEAVNGNQNARRRQYHDRTLREDGCARRRPSRGWGPARRGAAMNRCRRAPREPTWRQRGSRDSTRRSGAENQSPSAGDDDSPADGGIFRNGRSAARRFRSRIADDRWGSPAGRRPTEGSSAARDILVGWARRTLRVAASSSSVSVIDSETSTAALPVSESATMNSA